MKANCKSQVIDVTLSTFGGMLTSVYSHREVNGYKFDYIRKDYDSDTKEYTNCHHYSNEEEMNNDIKFEIEYADSKVIADL